MADFESGASCVKKTITSTNAGQYLRFTTGDEATVSAVAMHIVCDGSWSGTLVPVGRSMTKEAADDQIQPLPVPFRKDYLNGAVADGSVVAGGTAITGTSMIVIPATGKIVGLLVQAVASGSATVYCAPYQGPSVI